jgi:CRISPR/Cas system CSM-associated protein Csm3 (group 7 of RAMP superfamily)
MPEGADFTYPYRILQQPDKGPDRRYRPDLSRLRGYLGTFDCLIEVHTPLEVNYDQNAHFNKAPKIPGASMKGIIRSIVEFVGHGCMSISSHDRNDGRWELCGDQACCAACDMFGRLVRGKGGQINRGKVFIGDALPQTWDRHKQLAIYQGRPKEEHRAFYPKSGQYCYRKFYLHQPSAQQTAAKHSEKHVNDLFPVAPGSTFAFRVDFEGMEAAEVAVLAWGLELEPGLLHKLGRGKAHGLGSVKIRILTRRIHGSGPSSTRAIAGFRPTVRSPCGAATT